MMSTAPPFSFPSSEKREFLPQLHTVLLTTGRNLLSVRSGIWERQSHTGWTAVIRVKHHIKCKYLGGLTQGFPLPWGRTNGEACAARHQPRHWAPPLHRNLTAWQVSRLGAQGQQVSSCLSRGIKSHRHLTWLLAGELLSFSQAENLKIQHLNKSKENM